MRVLEFEEKDGEIIAWVRPSPLFRADSIQRIAHGDTETLLVGTLQDGGDPDTYICGFAFDRRYHTLEDVQRLMNRKKGEWMEEEMTPSAHAGDGRCP